MTFPSLILASRSPQRAQLLSQMGFRFTVLPVETDETISPNHSPEEAVKDIAERKATDWLKVYGEDHSHSADFLLTADTIVVCQHRIMGKPADRKEARAFLDLLAGNIHTVYTGVYLLPLSDTSILAEPQSFFDSSEVELLALNEQQKEAYLNHEEWQEAAGGYRIQGLGGALVKRISGSYPTVMGLPIHRIYGIVAQCILP